MVCGKTLKKATLITDTKDTIAPIYILLYSLRWGGEKERRETVATIIRGGVVPQFASYSAQRPHKVPCNQPTIGRAYELPPANCQKTKLQYRQFVQSASRRSRSYNTHKAPYNKSVAGPKKCLPLARGNCRETRFTVVAPLM